METASELIFYLFNTNIDAFEIQSSDLQKQTVAELKNAEMEAVEISVLIHSKSSLS